MRRCGQLPVNLEAGKFLLVLDYSDLGIETTMNVVLVGWVTISLKGSDQSA